MSHPMDRDALYHCCGEWHYKNGFHRCAPTAKVTPRKCKHPHPSDKYGETTHDWNGDIVYEVQYRECLDCGAWLSLGESDESDERVAVEIRAAEIAQDIERMGWTVLRRDSLEFAGWNGDGWAAWEGALFDPKYLAGGLARCIVEHDTETR